MEFFLMRMVKPITEKKYWTERQGSVGLNTGVKVVNYGKKG